MRQVSKQLWLLGFCVTMLGGGAVAAAESLDPGRLDPSWKGLDFGVTKEDVVRFLKHRITSVYETRIKDTMDVRERDRLAREMRSKLSEVGKDFVAFDGRQTGWGISVLRNEFAHGKGEELLDIQKGKERVYLFFTKGVYYKMIRTGVGRITEEWLDDLKQVYGPPDRVEFQDPENRSGIRAAHWNEGMLTVSVDDKTRLFQCVTIRWALSTADDAVKTSWGKSGTAGSGLNPLVKEATEPPQRDAVNPVDEILGRSSRVEPSPEKKPPRKRRKRR
ncbi:MAG: hypothetical protein ISR64_11835 [Deltaproteobacteria bacterium]|nr:hypothetical protein [Deltaproteobacteria bacterium]